MQINSESNKHFNSKKPVKKGTKSTLSVHSSKESQCLIPQPSITSQADSNQARYLSHIFPQSESDSSNQQYWNIVYRCVIYLKKQIMLTQTDDLLLFEQLKSYIEMDIHPVSKDSIGQSLLSNGYILSAYAILMGRIYSSYFLINYIFDCFKDNYQIKVNLQEFKYYQIISKQLFLQNYEKINQSNHKKSGSKRLTPIFDILEDKRDSNSQI